MIHGTTVYSKWDALDMAELNGQIAKFCAQCGGYHFRDADDEQEQTSAMNEYRALLMVQFPALAKQRGWM